MKKIIKFLKEKVFNKRGFLTIEMFVLLALIAGIALFAIPKLNTQANSTLTESITKIDSIDYGATTP